MRGSKRRRFSYVLLVYAEWFTFTNEAQQDCRHDTCMIHRLELDFCSVLKERFGYRTTNENMITLGVNCQAIVQSAS